MKLKNLFACWLLMSVSIAAYAAPSGFEEPATYEAGVAEPNPENCYGTCRHYSRRNTHETSFYGTLTQLRETCSKICLYPNPVRYNNCSIIRYKCN